MSRIVQKYGGSSVADPERIKRVARRVVAAAETGQEVCVVVSAMATRSTRCSRLAITVDPHLLRRPGRRIVAERLLAPALGISLYTCDGSDWSHRPDRSHWTYRTTGANWPSRSDGWDESHRGDRPNGPDRSLRTYSRRWCE